MGTIVFRVVKMHHFSGKRTGYAFDSLAMKSVCKISILVTPTHIGFIKSLNLVKVLTPASEIASLDPAPSKPLILAKAGRGKFEKKNQKFIDPTIHPKTKHLVFKALKIPNVALNQCIG